MCLYIQVVDAFKSCHERADVVEFLGELDLPDCWAAAGVVRNTVWDVLHERKIWTPLEDIDIAFFDPDDITLTRERGIEQQLDRKFPSMKFSVKNQARMHIRNRHGPYADSRDALSHWTETCTAVGIASFEGDWTVVAPCGLSDLLGLIVRPTYGDEEYTRLVLDRTKKKRWLEIWPLLRLWNENGKADA